MQPSPWYRPGDFYLLRVPTLSVGSLSALHCGRLDPGLGQHTEHGWQQAYQAGRLSLQQLAKIPEVELAVRIASPSLHEAIYIRAGLEGDNRRAQRAMERLMRYIIRMSTRATPFGYCAGVSFGRFAEQTSASCQPGGTLKFRADAHWLTQALKDIETQALDKLHVQIHPTLFTQGKRGSVPAPVHEGTSTGERTWFKMTPVVDLIRQEALAPIPYARLKHILLDHFTEATPEMVDDLLHTLHRIGALLTSLLPTEEMDPLQHVRAALDLGTEHDPQLIEQLAAIQTALLSEPIDLTSLLAHQYRLTPGFQGTPFQADTRAHVEEHTLPTALGREVALAAEILLRLGLYPQGLPTLHQARRIFYDTYGEQEVPLLELFKPGGIFDGFYDLEMDYGELPPEQQKGRRARTHLLRSLAVGAVREQQLSVELTPSLIQRLSLWEPGDTAPDLLDLYMHIYARSPEAIDRGDWRGLVTLLPPGGRSYRRFLHLFGEREQQLVGDLLQAGETLNPAYLCATLAFQPAKTRDLNVMHGPRYGKYTIPINCPTPAGTADTLHPGEIMVSVQHGHFLLRSRQHHRAVQVSQHHMLTLTHLPPLARFLLEASRDGEAYPEAFQWGNLDLPFLPRLTAGRIILTLAQWTLSAEALQEQGEPDFCSGAQWFEALQRWRAAWHVPRYVYLVEGEDRLLLDLEHTLMVEFLRQAFFNHQCQARDVILQEAPYHGERDRWLCDQRGDSYCAEWVIPLVRTHASPPPRLPSPAPRELAREERSPVDWIYVKLYGPIGLQNTLLIAPLQRFLQQHPSIGRWFFVRYLDPQPHLRLRFWVPQVAQQADVLQALMHWIHELQDDGLISRGTFDVYEREAERYGGPEAINNIERIFCAQSEAVCAMLLGHRTDGPVLFEAVLALDRLWADWGYSLAARRQMLQHHLPTSKETPWLRQQRQALTAFLGHPPEHLQDILATHQDAIVQGSAVLGQLASAGRLWRTEEEILHSLSHMLCNRLLGTRREDEREAYMAWRATVNARSHA